MTNDPSNNSDSYANIDSIVCGICETQDLIPPNIWNEIAYYIRAVCGTRWFSQSFIKILGSAFFSWPHILCS